MIFSCRTSFYTSSIHFKLATILCETFKLTDQYPITHSSDPVLEVDPEKVKL